jgi:hypothetical protein
MSRAATAPPFTAPIRHTRVPVDAAGPVNKDPACTALSHTAPQRQPPFHASNKREPRGRGGARTHTRAPPATMNMRGWHSQALLQGGGGSMPERSYTQVSVEGSAARRAFFRARALLDGRQTAAPSKHNPRVTLGEEGAHAAVRDTQSSTTFPKNVAWP